MKSSPINMEVSVEGAGVVRPAFAMRYLEHARWITSGPVRLDGRHNPFIYLSAGVHQLRVVHESHGACGPSGTRLLRVLCRSPRPWKKRHRRLRGTHFRPAKRFPNLYSKDEGVQDIENVNEPSAAPGPVVTSSYVSGSGRRAPARP